MLLAADGFQVGRPVDLGTRIGPSGQACLLQLRLRRQGKQVQAMSMKGTDPVVVGRIVGRNTLVDQLEIDAPAPEVFHGTVADCVGAGMRIDRLPGLDHKTGHTAPTQVSSKRKADRSAAGDQDWNFNGCHDNGLAKSGCKTDNSIYITRYGTFKDRTEARLAGHARASYRGIRQQPG
jgi:hypothetical protein